MDEESIRGQFSEFIDYFRLYAALDEEIFRVYSGLNEGESESDDDKSNLRSPHWLTNENTCISFFASIAQYSGSGSDSVSSEKIRRTKSALNNLICKLSEAASGSDPLALESLDAIRMGKNARKINVGTYTRRLLANGLKEYYRAEGDIPLIDAWNLAAD